MTPAVGIDLGTTNSVIAHINAAGRAEVIPNAEGRTLTPSVIAFIEDPPLVGEAAKDAQGVGEEQIAAFFKRSMGDPYFVLHLGGRDHSAIDLSALILGKLKRDAEAALGRSIPSAVITVPAYFNNAQRKATICAGEMAGLSVLQIINEPTAAALAYHLHETGKEEKVLVYDLGGGTFDVSLVKITAHELEVLATAGDHKLGGKDWDDRIASYLADRFTEIQRVNPLEDPFAFHDLLIRSENTKKTLSAREVVSVPVQYGGRREVVELTRSRFEDLSRDLMERTERLAEQVLQDKKLTWGDLTGVLLVGGSTRMPIVHKYVAKMSAKPPLTGVNVDEVVALGASIQAARKLNENVEADQQRLFLGSMSRTVDVISHSLGMIAISQDRTRFVNSIILPKNRRIPDEVSRPYTLRTGVRGGCELEVYMTQGESEVPNECSFLGKYRFTDIPAAESGTVIVEIRYRYDHNGVVQVSAKERKTGKPLSMSVETLPNDMSWLDKPPKEETEHKHVVAYLAIDLSGSMSGTPLAEAQEAAREFVRNTDLAHSSLGIISFADSVEVDSKATQNAKSLERAISNLHIGAVGGGNDASPFASAQNLLKKSNTRRFLVLLTDGVWSHPGAAIREAQACHADNIEIIAIGFGGADKEFLRKVATSEKGSFFAQSGELVATFGTIAQELTESGGMIEKKRGGLRFF